jgi:hypothetical protein
MAENERSFAAADVAERVRPLVNDILERFNQEHLAPAEAGMVILALTHRLMTVLESNPEARRHFVLTLIDMINRYMAGEFEGD